MIFPLQFNTQCVFLHQQDVLFKPAEPRLAMRKVRIAAMHFEALLVVIDSYYCWEKPVRSENAR
jgi:hypothetical protein